MAGPDRDRAGVHVDRVERARAARARDIGLAVAGQRESALGGAALDGLAARRHLPVVEVHRAQLARLRKPHVERAVGIEADVGADLGAAPRPA